MWAVVFLRGDHYRGWHCVNREASLDHWVKQSPKALTKWQSKLDPELRGDIFHVAAYWVSDDEILLVKSDCEEVFE